MNEDSITISLPRGSQAVVLFTGDKTILLHDNARDLDLNLTPIEKAVIVARLRAVADLIGAVQ